jgi:predicted Rdx family selenoprotein
MMKRLILFVLAAFSALMFTSCDNELDVTAEYKEIGVIYALINPSDSVHYFRIQKAFLGEGDATVMAQEPDSTYYPDILNVTLERVKNGAVLETIQLTRFIGPDKEEGEFPSSPNILYKTNGEYLYRDSEYKITVTNTQTGNVFWAQTPLVDTVKIVRPAVTNTSPINWVQSITSSDTTFNDYRVEYALPSLARVHNLIVRFRFKETLNGQDTFKSVDWDFGNVSVTTPTASNIEVTIDGESFYKFVSQKLNPVQGIQRQAIALDFIVSAGSEVLANYLSINSSTTSVLTSIPQYTNVNNGNGIFASRFTTVSAGKPLGTNSLTYLKFGKYTNDLGFQ